MGNATSTKILTLFTFLLLRTYPIDYHCYH